MSSLLGRFEKESVLVAAMRKQRIINGDESVARALAAAGTLVAFAPGEEIVAQGTHGDDAFFLLMGKVELRVHGELLPYGRAAGEVIGEFTAINPELVRTATVSAGSEVVALRCSSAALEAAGKAEPEVWRLLAVELTKKIEQRNQLISGCNERLVIFLIASEEHQRIAEEIHLAMARDCDVHVWSDDKIFPPGSYQLEILHELTAGADFGVVLAHPDDLLRRNERGATEASDSILFELGYLMSILGRHRTFLLVPQASKVALPTEFKGIRPMTYRPPDDGHPLDVAVNDVVGQLRDLVNSRKVRSRLGPG